VTGVRLLDTDVLIDIQRGHAPAVTWFASLPDLPSVPGLVVMELVQDARNARQVRRVLKLVAPLLVVWPTEGDCNRGCRTLPSTISPTAWASWTP
jgi:predicted nucleic acid-binding protein